MDNNETQEDDDIYQQNLIKATSILQQCQMNKEVRSCLQCKNVLTCDTRTHYVNCVYESMNKGSGGNFDFN